LCGIAGFVGLDDKWLLKKMCDAQIHRGPDGQGFYSDGKVGLGSRRLRIIDLQTGDQPIHNEDESVWVTFNGEIYNYIELRQELETLNHHFYTDSDTEILVHSYEEYGPDFVTSLRGMFVFALWDAGRRRLVLARDRLGKKPLYYGLINGILFFSSEAKGILQYEGYAPTVNLDAIGYFLTYGYIPAPLTGLNGISKLPPASLLVYEKGHIELKPYWTLSFARKRSGRDYSRDMNELGEILTEAVRIRLRSDVPLGAFLSGGIDSSTVVAIATRLSKSALKTFSVGFEIDAYDELPFARKVASKIGTDHYDTVLRPNAFEVLPTLVWHYDEPFADASAIPTYYVSQLARRHVKVVLTGDGGDEMFMGYPWMADPVFDLQTRLRLRLKALRVSRPDFDDRYIARVSRFSPSELKQAYVDEGRSVQVIKDARAFLRSRFHEAELQARATDQLSRADFVTVKSYLADDILVKVDRASMAVSLEPRCPFLDHILCEYAASLPSEMKMRGADTKIILREYVQRERLVPEEIIHRGKRGFGIPLENWFVGEIRGTLESLLLSRDSWVNSFLNPSYLSTLIANCSNVSYAQRVFSLAMLELWYRMFIGNFDRTQPKLDLLSYV